MNRICAIIATKGTGLGTIQEQLKENAFCEFIIFGNGIEIPYSGDDKISILESELELPLDRVYRQILSFVNHTVGSDGLLYLSDASKCIQGQMLNLEVPVFTIYENYVIQSVKDLFNLKDLDFMPVISILDIKNILESKTLFEFLDKFIRYGVLYTRLLDNNKMFGLTYLSKFKLDLINESDFKGIDKLVVNYLKKLIDEKSDTVQ